ncbi:MAG: nucleoside-diphosphate kinase [Candidatus Sumerlaeia bacterium]|nr:nucleoside-diphosphate kinase [Candidatus Sumerlaeia bacterium]
MIEQTLVLIKPDGVRRGLIGEVIRRIEAKGLRIVAMKMLQFDETLTRRHYGQYAKEDFYPALSRFIQSGPSVAMVVEGLEAIGIVRLMMGPTRALDAAPGTIRGDLALGTRENIVHGSDSPAAARREIACFFRKKEIFRNANA